jgi:hypothetical protein
MTDYDEAPLAVIVSISVAASRDVRPRNVMGDLKHHRTTRWGLLRHHRVSVCSTLTSHLAT